MKKCDMSNMDGVLDFEVMNASSPMRANLMEDYSNEFWTGEDFNNAIGKGKSSIFGKGTMFDKKERARRRALREKKQMQRQERRNIRTSSTAEARQLKAQAKLGASEANKEMAKGLQDQSGDIALANALASKSAETPTTEKKGLSTPVKIGIGVVALAVVGVVGYMLYKKSQKGK